MLSQTSRAIARKLAQSAVPSTIAHPSIALARALPTTLHYDYDCTRYLHVGMHDLRTPTRLHMPPAGTPSCDSDQPSQPAFVYEGPFAKTVTNLKRLSIASCAATTLLSPLLVAMAYDDGSTIATKAAVAATVCSFGLVTTGMLHWFTSPYVLRLVHVPGSDEVVLETKTVLGGTQTTTVRMPLDIKPANTIKPLSTFEVCGGTNGMQTVLSTTVIQAKGRVFYLDADNFADKVLLQRLTPEEPGSKEDKAVK